MKRSEAITGVKQLIELNLDSLVEIPDASLVAETILYFLEQKGMLPPYFKRKIKEFPYEEIVYEWEP